MKILDFKNTRYAIAYGMPLTHQERTELMVMYVNALLRHEDMGNSMGDSVEELNKLAKRAKQAGLLRESIDAIIMYAEAPEFQKKDIMKAGKEIAKGKFKIEWVDYE